MFLRNRHLTRLSPPPTSRQIRLPARAQARAHRATLVSTLQDFSETLVHPSSDQYRIVRYFLCDPSQGLQNSFREGWPDRTKADSESNTAPARSPSHPPTRDPSLVSIQ